MANVFHSIGEPMVEVAGGVWRDGGSSARTVS